MSIADPHETLETLSATAPLPRTLGERLRAARAHAGLDLTGIAARTRIPERTLAAIEADAYDQLPHATFAAGFVRSLAREVGVNEDEAARQYRAENTKLPPVPTAPPLRAIEPERVPSRGLAWVSGGVVALAIAGAAIWYARGRSDTAASIPAPATVAAPNATGPTATVAAATGAGGSAPGTAALPSGTAPPPTGATPAAGVQAAQTGAAATSPGAPVQVGPVTLTATQDVWVQIKNRTTGERVLSSVLAQGKVFAVPPGDLQLWTGRAGAIEVRVNGRLLPPLGGPVETIRNVDLSPAALVARAAGTPDAAAANATSAPARP